MPQASEEPRGSNPPAHVQFLVVEPGKIHWVGEEEGQQKSPSPSLRVTSGGLKLKDRGNLPEVQSRGELD